MTDDPLPGHVGYCLKSGEHLPASFFINIFAFQLAHRFLTNTPRSRFRHGIGDPEEEK